MLSFQPIRDLSGRRLQCRPFGDAAGDAQSLKFNANKFLPLSIRAVGSLLGGGAFTVESNLQSTDRYGPGNCRGPRPIDKRTAPECYARIALDVRALWGRLILSGGRLEASGVEITIPYATGGHVGAQFISLLFRNLADRYPKSIFVHSSERLQRAFGSGPARRSKRRVGPISILDDGVELGLLKKLVTVQRTRHAADRRPVDRDRNQSFRFGREIVNQLFCSRIGVGDI
jgi:hypothetical protein